MADNLLRKFSNSLYVSIYKKLPMEEADNVDNFSLPTKNNHISKRNSMSQNEIEMLINELFLRVISALDKSLHKNLPMTSPGYIEFFSLLKNNQPISESGLLSQAKTDKLINNLLEAYFNKITLSLSSMATFDEYKNGSLKKYVELPSTPYMIRTLHKSILHIPLSFVVELDLNSKSRSFLIKEKPFHRKSPGQNIEKYFKWLKRNEIIDDTFLIRRLFQVECNETMIEEIKINLKDWLYKNLHFNFEYFENQLNKMMNNVIDEIKKI